MTPDAIWAKSAEKDDEQGESLLDHTARVLRNVERLRLRCSQVADLCRMPRFWERVTLAVLFHDLGKCAVGFQKMLRNGPRFPIRHEVLSCAFLPCLLSQDAYGDFVWIATGVLGHHKDWVTLQEQYPRADPYMNLPDALELVLREIEVTFYNCGIEYLASFLLPLLPPHLKNSLPNFAITVEEVQRGAHAAIRRSLDAYTGLVQQLAGQNFAAPQVLAGQFLRGVIVLADHAGSAFLDFPVSLLFAAALICSPPSIGSPANSMPTKPRQAKPWVPLYCKHQRVAVRQRRRSFGLRETGKNYQGSLPSSMSCPTKPALTPCAADL
jgi:CRISPR-associated endonuclease/helicase Cas3